MAFSNRVELNENLSMVLLILQFKVSASDEERFAKEDSSAPRSTTVSDYLAQRFFGNSKGKN